MLSWKLIIDIGHTGFMFPLAAAIAAWLVAGRAWKMALAWCFMFAGGVSLVGLSKIAFLGWDTGLPSLGFKGLSGHVLCATAVLPVACFVALQRAPYRWRLIGVVCGMAVSTVLGLLIVYFDFHSASEATASFILGSCISLGYIRLTPKFAVPHVSHWSISFSVIAFAAVFALKPSVINHRLVDVALHLAGRDRPFEWPKKMICKARGQLNG